MSYEVTKNRVLQWTGIILVMAVFAGAYWYFQVFAGYKTSTGQTGILTSGLVGIWSFDGADVSGSTATDQSGSSNTGTISGATVTPGKVGQALLFDGVNDSVNAGNNASLQLTTGTVSAWIKTTGAGSGYRAIVVKGSAYGLFLVDNVLTVYDWGANAARSTGMNLSDGNWHFVTQVFQSGVASGTTVYVDGVLALTTTITVSSQAVQLGIGDSVGSSQFFAGTIDEPRVYNRTLSSSEIQSLYKLGQSDEVNSGASQAQGGTRLESGLAGYWRMDDGSGTSATDSSTNGNTGTLTNGPTWGTGQIGGAVSFDNVNDEIALGDVVEPDTITLSAWINRSGNGTVSIINKGNLLSSEQYSLFLDYASYGTVEFLVRAAGGGFDHCRTSSAGYATGQWYHVTGTYNGVTCRVYVNGIDKTETVVSDTTSGAINGGASSLTIGSAFNGLIDEVRVYNRSFSSDEVAQLYRLTTPTGVDTGLKGYWSFNGKDISGTSAYDRSGAGNTGTLTNGPIVTPGKVGQALSFDGNNDYVDVGDMASIEGQGKLTLAAWIKPGTLPGYAEVFGKSNTTSDDIALGPGGNLTNVIFVMRNGGDTYGYTGTGKLTVGTWTHIVGVFDGTQTGNANRLKVYVNGVEEPLTFGGTIPATTTSNAINMKLGGSTGGYFNGVVDEPRIYNRALPAAEIQSLYASGQSDEVNTGASQAQGTGRLDSGLAGYYKFDEGSGTSVADSSTNGNAMTLANSPTWGTGQINGAVTFGGGSDYGTATMGDIIVGSKVTTAFWYSANVSNGSTQNFYHRGSGGCAQYMSLVTGGASTDTLSFYYRDTSCGGIDNYQVSGISKNTWHHIVSTYDTASGVLIVYVDGVQQGTTTAIPGSSVATSGTLTFADNQGGGNNYSGSLDEFRIYNRTLSTDEVSQLYRLTTPTGVDTGLKGYWSFNGKDISGTTAYDRSGSGNNGTLTNGPTVTPGKVGQAIELDGSNDFVSIPASSSLNNLSTYTLTGWIKLDSFGGSNLGRIIDKRNSNSDGGWLFYVDGSTTLNFEEHRWGTIDGQWRTSTSTIATGSWIHVAVTYDAGSTTNDPVLYINGSSVSVTEVANPAGTLASETENVYIGNRSGEDRGFDGKIDEVRIYNRILTAGEITSLYNAGR